MDLQRVKNEEILLKDVQEELAQQLLELNTKQTNYQEAQKKQLYWQEQINTKAKN